MILKRTWAESCSEYGPDQHTVTADMAEFSIILIVVVVAIVLSIAK